MNPLFSSIETIKPKLQQPVIEKYQHLGIKTFYDLLTYKPRKYVNFSRITTIKNLPFEKDKQPICMTIKVIAKKFTRIPRRKLSLADITIQDHTGTLKITLFNQKFLYESIKEGETYAVTAIAKPKTKGLLATPNFERVLPGKVMLHSHRLVPVYPETTGITSKMIRYHIFLAQKILPSIIDPLPQSLLNQYNLPNLDQTIQALHYPSNIDQKNIAKQRLNFDQAFFVQIYLQKQKIQFQSKYAPQISYPTERVQTLIKSLPFQLTNAQHKATQEILTDLDSPNPMNRLLEGDVGTGKTIVAALAMFAVTQSHRQSALMAPTEILATQHFESFVTLWDSITNINRPTIALLTSKESRISTEPELGSWTSIKKSDLLKKIQSGSVDIVLGTHSLISDKVTYADLALTIVDEQHRFGVKQRAELQQAITRAKDGTHSTISHLLSMTATPIPRTLALSVYGDLDLSLLDEYPAGRKPVKTRVVTNSQRSEAYTFIRKHIQSGRQAFVVCPQIESSDTNDVRSVEETYQILSTQIYPDLRIGMMHGKLSTEEKDTIMQAFAKGAFDILVSTSVIEVGVNIPNASIMLIEGAERFGLAQLHQFRGRVGRGEYQSFCFLFETGADHQVMNERLIALESATNGFELAELDLELRGPGQFIGSTQSGLADISMEALTNHQLISDSRQAAKNILQQDLSLAKFPDLKQQLAHFQETVHFE